MLCSRPEWSRAESHQNLVREQKNQTLGIRLEGRVPTRNSRSQRRPRVAELGWAARGERRRPRLLHPLEMAKVAMSQQMFADIPSLIARLRAPVSPAGAARGRRSRRRGEEAFLDGGSIACRARKAVSCLASGHPSERSWRYDCRKIQRMTVQLGFAVLSPRVRAVVFRQGW